jgi:RNA polymerase sigma-70 factor (ECF subfamily)
LGLGFVHGFLEENRFTLIFPDGYLLFGLSEQNSVNKEGRKGIISIGGGRRTDEKSRQPQTILTDSPKPTTLAALGQAVSLRKESSPLEAEVLALFDRLRDRLMSYLLRFNPLNVQDCEEVVQEAFLALFKHLQRGGSRENLTGWLFRVVHNLGLKHLQRARRDFQNVVTLTSDAEEVVVDPSLNPEDNFAQDETRRHLRAVVRALPLPEQDQRCLALREEGLRYREIADVLGMSLGAVAKSLERSLERIARVAQRRVGRGSKEAVTL